MGRTRSSAGPLAAGYALLIAYACLYPFEGWRWPPGASLASVLQLPWLAKSDNFDDLANWIGYSPFGLLAFIALVRHGLGTAACGVLALCGPALLSYLLEVSQYLVPGRVPSARDFVLNTLGALMGVVVGWALHALGALSRWQRLRERWFEPDCAGARVLLVLWPLGLLFPAPLPLGLGGVFEAAQAGAGAVLRDAGWSEMSDWLLARSGVREAVPTPLREATAISLGLLAPALLAASVSRPGWRRMVLALGALPLAVGAMTLSTALNFGPAHAWAWQLPTAWPALLAGTALAASASLAPGRLVAALALACLAALVTLVAQAPSDPYYLASLQGWQQGEFVRFHGLAKWVGWLWPYAAMLWIVTRLARRG